MKLGMQQQQVWEWYRCDTKASVDTGTVCDKWCLSSVHPETKARGSRQQMEPPQPCLQSVSMMMVIPCEWQDDWCQGQRGVQWPGVLLPDPVSKCPTHLQDLTLGNIRIFKTGLSDSPVYMVLQKTETRTKPMICCNKYLCVTQTNSSRLSTWDYDFPSYRFLVLVMVLNMDTISWSGP